MTVLLLDPRWPTMIPMEAYGKLRGPVAFTGEVPVKVRWNFDDLLCGEDPQGEGALVSTDATDPQVRALIDANVDVIEAPSRQDPLWQARAVMSRARSIGEWEREQTHESLLPYLEEESAEFIQAVRGRAEEAEMLKELGDVFLQVLFHAEIAARRGAFTLDDVAQAFVTKMRSRAPYLFDGTEDVVGVEAQERLWAEGKARENA
ncbi:MazG nucleotide pyrophosphohydrolase domain-containing protein [Corynebacterium sp. YSMAA1_1_D6]|uniref:MazG nucleotide pyrophosphohydrolase domain-containing protein n=1 Tax=Corynebacterium sp. YSMAA1_1_D6 TaxID=3383589 RepID=UPI0038CFFA4E